MGRMRLGGGDSQSDLESISGPPSPHRLPSGPHRMVPSRPHHVRLSPSPPSPREFLPSGRSLSPQASPRNRASHPDSGGLSGGHITSQSLEGALGVTGVSWQGGGPQLQVRVPVNSTPCGRGVALPEAGWGVLGSVTPLQEGREQGREDGPGKEQGAGLKATGRAGGRLGQSPGRCQDALEEPGARSPLQDYRWTGTRAAVGGPWGLGHGGWRVIRRPPGPPVGPVPQYAHTQLARCLNPKNPNCVRVQALTVSGLAACGSPSGFYECAFLKAKSTKVEGEVSGAFVINIPSLFFKLILHKMRSLGGSVV
ncbi:collagen alpha-1(I) chain-like [Vulpes lagopus]|uniref:collagen alpha-1(I) chain-like n=1 Tax=Vulpes lagopus TaxID=494514 RepID=UPI001BC9F934|nr:collagen alpha-1(I) chain-like [Vulpes lagopus]